MKGLEGKIAIVTGGGKGIGRAIAERFMEEKLAGIGILEWDYELAQNTAKELDPTGEIVIPVKCNIADRDNVAEAVKEVADKFGRIDILVNNAGITKDKIFHKMEDKMWDDVIAVNLTGAYNMCKAVFGYMREQESGAIVNISSTSAWGNVGQANYCATKAGLLGLTKTLAMEGGRKGIRVNTVCPAHVMTDMLRTVPEEKRQHWLDNYIALHRFGEPSEIASVVAFLSSDEASWVTGQEIVAGGTLFTVTGV